MCKTNFGLGCVLCIFVLPVMAMGQVEPLPGGQFAVYTDETLTIPGLVGSYVDTNLRGYSPQDDWRITQTISGSRVDAELDFTDSGWGLLAEVGLTGGSDADWNDFSVQWDGFIEVVTDQMTIATISDDSSRMWIDLNGDGLFDSAGPEFIDNNWGSGQAATQGPVSVPLSPGAYRIRVQYEEAAGGNVMQLISPPLDAMRIAYLIPSNRTAQTDGVENIQQLTTWLRGWMCEQMDRNGFGHRTIRIETEADGVTPKVHVITLAETDEFLRGDIWGRVNDAAGSAGIPTWTPGQVWLLVPEIHAQQPDGSLLGGVALGASFGSGSDPGVAMIGSAFIALGPQALTDDRAYDGLIIPEIGPLPLVQDISFPWFEGTTLSSVMSAGLGAMLHEWLHGLGMPHDFRNDANAHGNLMGNGLRGIRGALYPLRYFDDDTRLAYGAAMALRTSRYLTECSSAVFPLMPPPAGLSPANVAKRDHYQPLGPAGLSDHCAVEPWPTRTQRGGLRANTCNDLTAPVVQLMTSGTVDPVDGLLSIAFEASDDVELATALLIQNGNLVGEQLLAGASYVGAFETPYYSTTAMDTYSVLVYDACGNRSDAQTSIVASAGAERAPQPSFRIVKSRSSIDVDVLLDAGGTSDPDDSSASLLVEWDVEGNEIYTPPTTIKTRIVGFATPATVRVRMRATDPAGNSTVSTAIGLRIENPCEGDVDGDGEIDLSDLASVLTDFACGPPTACVGDADGDGDTDLSDLATVLANFGEMCP